MSFREIELHFPAIPGIRIWGSLIESTDARDLGQDMLSKSLPTGVHIHAGWYPEGSPSGRYRITVRGAIEMPATFCAGADETAQQIREYVRMLTDKRPEPITESAPKALK